MPSSGPEASEDPEPTRFARGVVSLAPGTMVTGNRYTARKLIQRLGRSHDRGEAAEVARLRALLEGTHLQGRVRYELRFERYRPLEKWRTGANDESRSLAKFRSGGE